MSAAGRQRSGTDPRLAAEVARWVRPEVRALSAYRVQEAGGLVKLDAMENPWSWPGALAGAWLAELRGLELNRYPDPRAGALCARLRAVLGIPAELGLLLGNGSDELIQLVALAVAGADRVALAPEPTFVMYRVLAAAAGLGFAGVPLRGADFALDREAMLAAIERHRPAVVFLAWPNNPTGNLFDAPSVEAVLEAAPGLVVVDEAYEPFAGESLLGRLAAHPRLLLLRTLSKLGLAGLRLGLLAGHPAWLAEIDKLRLPYNVNTLSQHSAEFALRHYDVLREQSARIRAERARLEQALGALAGVRTWPSRANFVLFRVAPRCAPAVHEGLRRRGVLIKCLDGSHPLLADCLRVTVGTPAENALFLEALRATLGETG